MVSTKPAHREEIIGALVFVLLFAAIMIGREAGNFYASYEEMKSLKVLFRVEEEELSAYLRGIMGGETRGLDVGLTITLPAVSDTAKLVTDVPDYARRWLISVALSPVVVRQPSVSDVELQLFVEGEFVAGEALSFPKQKVPYLGLVNREIAVNVEDPLAASALIEAGANAHGGEVEASVRGRVRAHLWVLETWLPFTSTMYTLVEPQYPTHISSEWRTLDGLRAESVGAGEATYVYVRLGNTARVHSFRGNLTLLILRDGAQAAEVSKETPLAPDSEGSYIFQLPPAEPGVYTYALMFRNRVLVDASSSPQLRVG